VRVKLRTYYGLRYPRSGNVHPQGEQTIRVFTRRALGLSTDSSHQKDLVLLLEYRGSDLGAKWKPFDVWLALGLEEGAYEIVPDGEPSLISWPVWERYSDPSPNEDSQLSEEEIYQAYEESASEKSLHGKCGIGVEVHLLPDSREFVLRATPWLQVKGKVLPLEVRVLVHDNKELFLSAVWTADRRQRVSLHGLEVAKKSEIELVLRGLALLRMVSRRGRPRLEETRLARVIEVGSQIDNLKRKDSTITWKMILGQLARAGVHISEKTAQRWWERYRKTR